MSTDDDDRGVLATWSILAVTLLTIGLLVVAIGTGWDGSSGDDSAAAVPAATATAPAADPATAPATDPATTAPGAIPVEVLEDPLVQRLARGRTLPFTAGPWQRQQWRDGVYKRLRAVTQERAEKVDDGSGFAILIQ